jgi:hypothetical protein
MPRGANFSREERDSFLDIVEDILPLSTTQWESVVETHSASKVPRQRALSGWPQEEVQEAPHKKDSYRRPAVRRAKQMRNAIIELMVDGWI